MYKRSFLILIGLICPFFIAFAQYTMAIDKPLYTIDKQIPSYMSIVDRGILSKKKVALKSKPGYLESILMLNDETAALLTDTLTDIVGGFHESYKEYYKGIEVEGTRCTIHYDCNGQPTMVNGNFRTINQLDVSPSLNESDALQLAIKYVGAKKYSWEDSTYEQLDGKYCSLKFSVSR